MARGKIGRRVNSHKTDVFVQLRYYMAMAAVERMTIKVEGIKKYLKGRINGAS